MQIKKDYAKMIEQFEKMEKEKQAAIQIGRASCRERV